MRTFFVALATALVAVHLAGYALAGEKAPSLPPRFLGGVALYKDDQLINILFGKSMFLEMEDCRKDALATVARFTSGNPPEGTRIEGICVPIHTYSVKDLIPPAPSIQKNPNAV